MTAPIPNDLVDEHVDEEIASCLDLNGPRSFFLFAGAGSGKTRSLVHALQHIRESIADQLSLEGRRVAVVTYTNAACDEIVRRVQFDPLFKVSTIHSFCWLLIQGFTHDIREWLRAQMKSDIAKLQVEEAKGRAGTKASAERQASIRTKENRLATLDKIVAFVYDPNGDNIERNSLSHYEVIKIASSFITTKATMARLIVDGYPIILVDEGQDTNEALVDALFAFQSSHKKEVSVGFFGDMMQRIYPDGKKGLGEDLPPDWARPTKKLNWRCPCRVIRLINRVRETWDHQVQLPRSDAPEGWVRLFVLPASTPDKLGEEQAIATTMSEVTGDSKWANEDGYKALILEHHMAARRMHFDDMFAALYPIDRFRTGLLSGTLSIVTPFSNRVLPLMEAQGDNFEIARIVRSFSPLLSPRFLSEAKDQRAVLTNAKAAVDALLNTIQTEKATFREALQRIVDTGLFEVPDELHQAAQSGPTNALPDEQTDPQSQRMKAINAFLDSPFAQIKPYVRYVSGAAGFSTHQGVKGLEFPRVMVVMDDTEARGFAFKYEKLFGGTDHEDSVTIGTRRLFYVTCSRALRSLALVAYSQEPERVRRFVLDNGWFEASEIVMQH